MIDLFSILTLSISIVAAVISYIDTRRRLNQEREFSQLMANLINTLREELKLFKKHSMTSEDIKRLRERNYRRVKGISANNKTYCKTVVNGRYLQFSRGYLTPATIS